MSIRSYHQVVPAFWAPMPTNDGGPASSPGPSAGGVKSNPTSQGAYRPSPCSTGRRRPGGSRAKPSRRRSRRLIVSGPGARSRLPHGYRAHNYRPRCRARVPTVGAGRRRPSAPGRCLTPRAAPPMIGAWSSQGAPGEGAARPTGPDRHRAGADRVCGIAGLFDPDRRTGAEALGRQVEAMTAALTHRGPDAEGYWLDADHGLAFGHRRLSVVELGPEGSQPMVSPDGRWVLDYNGELYNYREIRKRLVAAGMAFRGGSDTEVLVGAVQEWGLDSALEALEGMFALALWDRHLGQLHLVRDRFGEKPLYYGWVGDRLAFASELKSLCLLAGVPGRDRPGRGGALPAPQLRARAAHHLPAGGQAAPRAPAHRGHRRPNRRHPCRPVPTGRRATRSKTPVDSRSRGPPGPWPTAWSRCCPTRWRPAWWPTCRSAPSFPAASTRAWSWR